MGKIIPSYLTKLVHFRNFVGSTSVHLYWLTDHTNYVVQTVVNLIFQKRTWHRPCLGTCDRLAQSYTFTG